ncbi:hypothetical protein X942_5837 [Burkholderia pseudomallei MSHR5596]|nr:hypothetical protein X942_5837 [Burkholderia pseudomallei MSHR5596]
MRARSSRDALNLYKPRAKKRFRTGPRLFVTARVDNLDVESNLGFVGDRPLCLHANLLREVPL